MRVPDRLVSHKRRTQVARSFCRRESRLPRCCATAPDGMNHRYTEVPCQRSADFQCLVESAQPMPAPVQGNREYGINVFRQVRAGMVQQSRERRSVKQSAAELECLDGRIDRELVCKRRNRSHERCLLRRRPDPGQVVIAVLADLSFVGPDQVTAERTTRRHDGILECAQHPEHAVMINVAARTNQFRFPVNRRESVVRFAHV